MRIVRYITIPFLMLATFWFCLVLAMLPIVLLAWSAGYPILLLYAKLIGCLLASMFLSYVLLKITEDDKE